MLPRTHGGLRRPDQCLASFRKPRVMINERGIMVRLPLADPRMSALPPIAILLGHDAMSAFGGKADIARTLSNVRFGGSSTRVSIGGMSSRSRSSRGRPQNTPAATRAINRQFVERLYSAVMNGHCET